MAAFPRPPLLSLLHLWQQDTNNCHSSKDPSHSYVELSCHLLDVLCCLETKECEAENTNFSSGPVQVAFEYQTEWSVDLKLMKYLVFLCDIELKYF